MRSFVHVQVQGEITPNGGNDQNDTMEHPQGRLRHKDWTSCEKTPYLLIAGMATPK
jgi:hypothetical protein